MILVSWTNLEAVKLLPWRAPDYGGLPTVKMVYLTLFTQLFEDIPQRSAFSCSIYQVAGSERSAYLKMWHERSGVDWTVFAAATPSR